MLFKSIALITKENLPIDSKILDEIHKAAGGSVIHIISYGALKKKDLLDKDLVITLGGDGTFVKAGNLIEHAKILGINIEPHKSEGALTSIDIHALDSLKNVFEGNFTTLQRQRAKITLNGVLIDEHALNEVYVGAASQFHSSRYVIEYGPLKEEHRSSGVIISTGTGSPAWFYSAGGEIFHHGEEILKFIVREPYFGKRIFTPKILKGEIKKGEKLTLLSKRDHGGILAINDTTYEFNEGARVQIELSDKPLEVVVPR